jgi:hypothetical protein
MSALAIYHQLKFIGVADGISARGLRVALLVEPRRHGTARNTFSMR